MGFKTRVKGGESRDERAVTCNGRLLHRWADTTNRKRSVVDGRQTAECVGRVRTHTHTHTLLKPQNKRAW